MGTDAQINARLEVHFKRNEYLFGQAGSTKAPNSSEQKGQCEYDDYGGWP